MPAHTLAWGRAFPEMVVNCSFSSAQSASSTDVPALNPSKNVTYDVIFQVLSAVARVFPDKFMHLGADEVRAPTHTHTHAVTSG